jgi:acyl-CoA synthetase (AMP-forming)/AMP-acid ligase II
MPLFQSRFVDKEDVGKVLARLARQRKGKEPLTILQGSLFFDVLASAFLNNSIGYGLTETSPNSHFLPEVDSIPKLGSVGFLLPNLEARLLVDGDGNGDIEAGVGEAVELWLRGPTIMKVCFSFPSQSQLYP